MKTTVHSAANTTWSESTLTRDNKPASDGKELAAATVAGTAGQWYELDVTAFLKAELAAGRTVVTLVLRSPSTTAAYASFNSDDAAANLPELAVTT